MKLRPDIQQNIYDDDAVAYAGTRDGYGEALVEFAKSDERVVALSADLTGSTRTKAFADAFPERFVQCGIAEQSMASVASGMASMGKVPFVASYAMFSPGRSWEQVRTTIAYNNQNVKIIGAHAGVSVGPDGATHQAIEDIALMRVLPNMVVVAPCDIHEARKAVYAAFEYTGPVYIRLAREKTPMITTADTPFTIGKAVVLAEHNAELSPSVGLVSTGVLARNALVAGKQLEEKGIGASVLHMPTIKPLDTEALTAFAEKHEVLVTIEEHQRAGGLGSAIVESFSESAHPPRVVRIGIDDQFGQSGTPEELFAHYGLDATSIVDRVERTLKE